LDGVEREVDRRSLGDERWIGARRWIEVQIGHEGPGEGTVAERERGAADFE